MLMGERLENENAPRSKLRKERRSFKWLGELAYFLQSHLKTMLTTKLTEAPTIARITVFI
jgi:hypothetical protein